MGDVQSGTHVVPLLRRLRSTTEPLHVNDRDAAAALIEKLIEEIENLEDQKAVLEARLAPEPPIPWGHLSSRVGHE